jgi:hypothetical protein
LRSRQSRDPVQIQSTSLIVSRQLTQARNQAANDSHLGSHANSHFGRVGVGNPTPL